MKTYLAIGAHQDDLELIGMQGILESYHQADKQFIGIVVTDGRNSPRTGDYGQVSDQEMVAIRKQEQAAAAGLGRYADLRELDFTSNAVKAGSDRLMQALHAHLLAFQPDVIYLHSPFDRHATHQAVLAHALKALLALPQVKRPQAVYGVEVWGGLDWVPAPYRVALDVSKRPHLRQALIGSYDSQIAGGKRYDLAYQGRVQANATFGESHDIDQSDAISWAVDLGPIVRGELTQQAYLSRIIEAFAVQYGA